MARADTLTLSEVRIIKAMLLLRPRLTYQAILSYFSRPGRDINHRVISQINAGVLWSTESVARESEAIAFMAASRSHHILSAAKFVAVGAAPVAGRTPQKGYLNLNWWPAGQGLFASGMITGLLADPLTWVFDCGTTSKKVHLDSSLKSFESQLHACGSRSIRLAALSHFDTDHLSGLVQLIGMFPIRTLLLPYILPWRRLVIAFELGLSPGDPEFDFFVDPVAYLLAVGDGRIEEIVWVQPSGPDDLPDAGPDGPEGPYEGPEGFEGDLKIEYDEVPEDASDDPSADSNTSIRRVRFLKKGGLIICPGLWEFVPYNDAELAPKATGSFQSTAQKLLKDFLHVPAGKEKALADLKKLYDATYINSKERNQISLFLYSGPLTPRISLHDCLLCRLDGGGRIPDFSQMHTGDGDLTLGPRYDAFERFFKAHGRLGRSKFLQVMHHGSAGNWHKGIASKLDPRWSVFSSDPNHKKYRHPHPEVLRDFWAHRPVQVDKVSGFYFHGELEVF